MLYCLCCGTTSDERECERACSGSTNATTTRPLSNYRGQTSSCTPTLARGSPTCVRRPRRCPALSCPDHDTRGRRGLALPLDGRSKSSSGRLVCTKGGSSLSTSSRTLVTLSRAASRLERTREPERLRTRQRAERGTVVAPRREARSLGITDCLQVREAVSSETS